MEGIVIAEAYKLGDGLTRYVLEYHREGQGVQRPTFDLPSDMGEDEAIAHMLEQVKAEQKLNVRPRRKKQIEELVGRRIDG